MKQLLTAFLLAFATQQAHAVVADHFSCELKLSEVGIPDETSQTFDFSVARVPVFHLPVPNGSTTKASFDLHLESKNKKRTVTTNITFYYHHAVRSDASGRHPEARQTSCAVLSASLCDHTSTKEGDYEICGSSKGACSAPSDPFNPRSGWAEVILAPDGTPLFDDKVLVPIEAKIYDDNKVERGTVKFKCDYKGTYS